MPTATNRSVSPRPSGFTLLELLIVIGIIGVLVGILIPVVGKVRTAARTASTTALLSQLGAACDRYYSDFHSYPGPFSNNQIYNDNSVASYGTVDPTGSALVFSNGASQTIGKPATFPTGYNATAVNFSQVTMSENLVLALLGGLNLDSTASPPKLIYDPSSVGNGPMSLNTASPKRYAPYIESNDLSWTNDSAGLKTGSFSDGAGAANDSVIPEFVDRYSDPLPILYLRAKVGASTNTVPTAYTSTDNPVITDNKQTASGIFREGQYDISQIIGYTKTSIGVGKSLSTSAYYINGAQPSSPPPPPLYHGLSTVNPPTAVSGQKNPTNQNLRYQYPYDCYPYFLNDVNTHSPKGKDAYIIISAGPDRVYGTSDDITSFGSVTPGQ
jgi:prepilin-type N-terminal cleavage/methylation domain-containing protein